MWRVARSSVYARRQAVGAGSEAHVANRDALYASQSHDRAVVKDLSRPRKRGARTPIDDATLVTAIRGVLEASPFHTEGHRKVRIRLRTNGIRVGKHRVLRLMRTHRLLAPTRRVHAHGDRAHSGTITTQRSNEL